MADISGKWVLVSSTGFAEFHEALISVIQPEEKHSIEFTKVEGSEGEWTQCALFGNNFLQALWLQDYGPLNFTEGKEYKHRDLSGSDGRSVVTIDGNKLTQRQWIGQGDSKLVQLVTEREFNGDKMTTKFSYTYDWGDDGQGCGGGLTAEFERVATN